MKFTKTETLRRLRHLAALARLTVDLPSNVRVEVGYRVHPVRADDFADAGYQPEGDDLRDFDTLTGAAWQPEVAREGSVVHLYLSTTGPWGELKDVVVGWLGTNEVEPMLVSVNGRPTAEFVWSRETRVDREASKR